MIVSTVEFPVFCAAVSSKQAKKYSSYPRTMTMLFQLNEDEL